MANDSGSGMMMMMVMVAGIAFIAYFFLKKQGASSDVQQAAAQPSTTVIQPQAVPQTTIIETPVAIPYFGPAIFIEDDPDFEFPRNPCHFWPGARYDPDGRRCYFPYHRDCDDRGLVWDADHDSCIRPPTPHINLHDPVTINVTINETATRGGRITNTINPKTGGGGTTNVNVNTTPSATWSFRLANGKTIGPSSVVSFASNCHSALGANDPGCAQVKSMCQSGSAANQDVCTALKDAGMVM